MGIKSKSCFDLFPSFARILEIGPVKSEREKYNKATQHVIENYIKLRDTPFFKEAVRTSNSKSVIEAIDEARATVISDNAPIWISLAEIQVSEDKKITGLLPLFKSLVECMSSSMTAYSTDPEGSALWIDEADALWGSFRRVQEDIADRIMEEQTEEGDLSYDRIGALSYDQITDAIDLLGFVDMLRDAIAHEALVNSYETVSEYL